MHLPALTLITGTNTVDLRQHVRGLRRECEQAGKTLLESTLTESHDLRTVLTQLQTPGFFGLEEQVIILHNCPPSTSNALSKSELDAVTDLLPELLNSLTEDTPLICISPQPDKRTKLYKQLSKAAETLDFPGFPLSRGNVTAETYAAAREWLTKRLPAALHPLAADIVRIVGIDPERLARESHKVILYASGNGSISAADLPQILTPDQELGNFMISSALQKGSLTDIITALRDIINSGDPASVALMRDVLPSLRQLRLLAAAQQAGVSSDQTGLHPFIAKQLSNTLRTVGTERAITALDQALELDTAARQSSLGSTATADERMRIEIEEIFCSLLTPTR